MRLTKSRLAKLLKCGGEYRPKLGQMDFGKWSRDYAGLARELVELAVVGFDAIESGNAYRETVSIFAETQAKTTIAKVTMYRDRSRQGWVSRKRAAAARAALAAQGKEQNAA
jgi:hypothetical protein